MALLNFLITIVFDIFSLCGRIVTRLAPSEDKINVFCAITALNSGM